MSKVESGVVLTDPSTFKYLDPKDVYGSTRLFTAQLEQMAGILADTKLHQDFSNMHNVVVCGMGGSAYGGHVAETLLLSRLKVPVTQNSQYEMPGYVNGNSVIVSVSYSGSTEETLSNTKYGQEKGATVTGLTSGGKLAEILGEKGIIFEAKHNPSGQPRLGTGYIVLGTLGVLSKIGAVDFSDKEIAEMIENVSSTEEATRQKAIELAGSFKDFTPMIFAAEHLVGNAHILRNQFNETAKSFSVFEDIPELNHHLMEGLRNPNQKQLKALFLESNSYSSRVKKRIAVTKDVLKQNGVSYEVYNPEAASKTSDVFNTLSFGGYLTLNLALLYGQDPSLIPWVDYFKEQIDK